MKRLAVAVGSAARYMYMLILLPESARVPEPVLTLSWLFGLYLMDFMCPPCTKSVAVAGVPVVAAQKPPPLLAVPTLNVASPPGSRNAVTGVPIEGDAEEAGTSKLIHAIAPSSLLVEPVQVLVAVPAEVDVAVV